MKPKKPTKDESKPARRARRPDAARKPDESGTPSSRPERENDDTEVVPPDAGTAEAEQERAEERAADDGMPGEDQLRPGSGR
jgi:hypothetical protein